MPRHTRHSLPALLALTCLLLPALLRAQPPKATIAAHGLVVAVSQPGAEAGLAILKQGGTAVDAAVATAFALAVTYPAAGNIGGGGFMMVHPGKGAPVCIEYRETAPAAATEKMYAKGETRLGHRVVGVPGTVRGMELAHKKFGKLPWKTLLQPAIKLAEDGFAVDSHTTQTINEILADRESLPFPEMRRVFRIPTDKVGWIPGDRLVQPELAQTLRRLADEGPDAFYKGAIAEQLVAEMKAGGGLITLADLAAYKAHERAPIHGVYRGHDVYGPPPPSSGGICLVEMLNILENFELRKHKRCAPETLHLMIEAMRRAFLDRARHLGDPAFTKIPAQLTSKEYARELAKAIDLKEATVSEHLADDIPLSREGDSTTHFSVIDKDGMAVANTYTLEHSFGSRVAVKGAGFLLNNQMADFNWYPGFTDRKGTIGTKPNLIAPGKRMLSSQTPTIVTRDGKVLLVTGSPGSRTIINTVLNVVVNVIDYEMPIAQAVAEQRLHHAWFPDQVFFEGTNHHPQSVARLKQMGHRVEWRLQGDAHSIWVDFQTGRYHGAADKRCSGHAAAY